MNASLLLADGIWDYINIGPELIPRLVAPLWVMTALLLLSIGGLWFWRRYKKKLGQLRELSPKSLVRIWKAFIREVPSDFRRFVLLYQPFVVLGESGSGKSSLIGRYTDWKGQAAQFYPSYSVDPSLQVYLGSRALVQEVPATLLADTSPKARVALVNLWKIFRKREPIVVVTVSAAALRKATPEALRTQAQTIRGKINVLSRIANKPIQARVVVTHMDQVEGYLAYSQFVEKNDIPHQLQLDPKAPDGKLEHSLESQETYLPLALTSLSSRNYLKVLTFLNKAPETFVNLGILLRALKEPDPLSFEPEIKDLYLTSDQGGSPSAVSNPFASSWTDHTLAIERASFRRHQLITWAILVLGVAYSVSSFFYERWQLVNASTSVAQFEKAPDDEDSARDACDRIKAFEGAESSFVSYLLPRFYPNGAESLRERYTNTVRQRYVLPRFDERFGLSAERALYLTSLVRAARNNELGRYILQGKRPEEWANALRTEVANASKLTPEIIRSYVELSEPAWDGLIPLPPVLPAPPPPSPYADSDKWREFVSEVRSRIERGAISPDQLAELKTKARDARDGFDSMRRERTTKDVYTMLLKLRDFPRKLFLDYIGSIKVPDWLEAQSEELDKLLDLVLDKERSTIEPRGLPARLALGELTRNVQAVEEKLVGEGTTIRIQLEQSEPVVIETRRWYELMKDGKARFIVERFLRENQDSGSRMFFTRPGVYADIVMKPSTSSDFLFSGRGSVPGIYTRAAYEREVQAKLLDFERTFGFGVAAVESSVRTARLDDKVVEANLEQLVREAAQQYANDYYQAWRKYYEAWSVETGNLGALRIVLEQMSLPSSRFDEFLNTIRANTSFDSSSSRSLSTLFDKLAPFRQLDKLEVADRGQSPELEKYRSILRGVVRDLDGPEPDESKEKVSPQEMRRTPLEFAKLCTPLGRLSLAILYEHRDSKRKLVEEWLQANGIGEEWKRPFLEPIQQLHQLGLADLNDVVTRNWNRRVLSQAIPLLEKFPFNRNAPADATPRDVEDRLLPSTGLFWVAWRNLIAPLCVEDQGGWKPLPGTESMTWPKGMFDTVSALQRVTHTLWDKDAVPKPLTFEIEPQTLPITTKAGKPAIILSFLNVGKSSVFGFNQKLYWQTLSVEWAKRPQASAGLQVGDPASNTKSFRALNEAESAWSFYRLLLRDRHAEQNVWVFDMTQGEPEYPPPLLKFQFKEDPWEIFNVPRTEEEKTTNVGSK